MSSFKIYYPDSKDILQEGETLPDGRRHGKSYKYYQNGKIKSEGEYHYDKPDGIWHDYDEKGNERRQVTYEDGVNTGWKEWDENHVLRNETTFVNGKCVAFVNYDKNGIKEIESTTDSKGVVEAKFYREGIFNGRMLKYPDGRVVHERNETQTRLSKTLKDGQKRAQTKKNIIHQVVNQTTGRK